jgi:hypothetical protein
MQLAGIDRPFLTESENWKRLVFSCNAPEVLGEIHWPLICFWLTKTSTMTPVKTGVKRSPDHIGGVVEPGKIQSINCITILRIYLRVTM